jgi:hypothetical protein
MKFGLGRSRRRTNRVPASFRRYPLFRSAGTFTACLEADEDFGLADLPRGSGTMLAPTAFLLQRPL